MTTYSPTGKPKDHLWFYETCSDCGIELDGPSEKRVSYLLKSHRYWIHERGLR
jgi:hypothetical protein